MKNKKAQASIEFSFAMIVALLMTYTIIQLFNWSGRDLIEQKKVHEDTLIQQGGSRDYVIAGGVPVNSRQLEQINPVMTTTTRFNGIWDGN